MRPETWASCPCHVYEGNIKPVRASCGRAKSLGYPGRSPPVWAMADYLFKDHKPWTIQVEARLRELFRIIYSKTAIPSLPGEM